MTFSDRSMPTKAVAIGGGLAIAAGLWTVLASLVFLLGTGLLPRFAYPYYQWWVYLPYAGANATVKLWLTIGGGLASLFVLSVPIARFATRPKGPALPHRYSAHACRR